VVGPSQLRVLALAAELGVETFEHHRTGTPINRFADFAASAGELGALTAELDSLAATLPAGAPWRAEHAVEWDRQTFHSWLAGRSCSPAALAYLHVITIVHGGTGRAVTPARARRHPLRRIEARPRDHRP
jgi:monoamine oxidase